MGQASAYYRVEDPIQPDEFSALNDPSPEPDLEMFELIHEHGRRVARLTFDIAKYFGCSDAMAGLISRCAIHHDIGKLFVSPYLLFFPGPLTEIEKLAIREHARLGSLISHKMFPRTDHGNSLIASVCCHHHERWDGSGYPDRLAGTEIPLAARIVAVADVFDALISDRPYRQPISPEAALKTIIQSAGSHFDPDIVEAFEHIVKPYLHAPVIARSNDSEDRWFYSVAHTSIKSRRHGWNMSF